MSANFKNYLQLHFIVFIWGFTAILGKLITIDALPLVWYRMLIASALILVFILLKKYPLKVSRPNFGLLVVAGIAIALHWVTFFLAIKVANISVALATMSTGAFFGALLEPIWFKRKIIPYEIVLGFIVILGLLVIFKVETRYAYGIGIALISAFLSAVFSLINGKLIKTERSTVISFYELTAGVVLLTVYLAFTGSFNASFFQLSQADWGYIFILASFCTAFAFIAAVNIMTYISPYSVMLTTNLEPVYGILLAFVIFGDDERMSPLFYVGGLIILATVIADGILKKRAKIKEMQ